MAPKCAAKVVRRRMTRKGPELCNRAAAAAARANPAIRGRTAMEVLAKITEQHRCPISQQLLVDPVMAEDGHIYERRAISRWFLKKKASPTTNMPIGDRLVPAVAARQTVGELVEQGMVDAEASVNWFLQRGRARATRTDGAGPDLEGAAADFQWALGAAATPEQRAAAEFQLRVAVWLRNGAGFAAEVKAMGQESCAGQEIHDWMLELAGATHAVVAGPLLQERRLAGWLDLPRGTRVSVLGDVDELRRLCERPPPGAEKAVAWVPGMQHWAGAACTVQRRGDEAHKNYDLAREGTPGGHTFWFPYDALVLTAGSA